MCLGVPEAERGNRMPRVLSGEKTLLSTEKYRFGDLSSVFNDIGAWRTLAQEVILRIGPVTMLIEAM